MADRQIHLTPLKEEKRLRIPTREMARHLGRAESTLHQWSHFGSYPACLAPTKAGKLLMWPVAGALEYLGEAGRVSRGG